MSIPIPTGYMQSAGSQALQSNPRPLAFSIVGEPIPAAHNARVRGMRTAIFPQHFPAYRGNTGPLRGSAGGA